MASGLLQQGTGHILRRAASNSAKACAVSGSAFRCELCVGAGPAAGEPSALTNSFSVPQLGRLFHGHDIAWPSNSKLAPSTAPRSQEVRGFAASALSAQRSAAPHATPAVKEVTFSASSQSSGAEARTAASDTAGASDKQAGAGAAAGTSGRSRRPSLIVAIEKAKKLKERAAAAEAEAKAAKELLRKQKTALAEKERLKKESRRAKVAAIQAATIRKAPSAYNLFMKEQFPVIHKQLQAQPTDPATTPSAVNARAMAEVGRRFKALTKEQRRPYDEQVTALKDKVEKQRKELKAERAKSRSLTPYLHFAKEVHASMRQAEPAITVKEAGRRMGEMWRRMSAAEKQKYVDMSVEERARKGLSTQSKVAV